MAPPAWSDHGYPLLPEIIGHAVWRYLANQRLGPRRSAPTAEPPIA